MATKTISISEEAYEKLKSLKESETDSFSTVIIRYFPKKKKLSELLAEIGHDPELANSIEGASKEMRKASIREVKL
ncbi:MAG: antitoxin VapB family protein [Methermicoccaceae archaeon]